MATKKVDWKKLWNSFDRWYNRRDTPVKICPKCKRGDHISGDAPQWDEQQAKIQKLVNKQLGP